jgi:hypothetical protein
LAEPSRKSDRQRVTVTSEDPTHAMGSIDNVLVVLTRQPPTVESVERFTNRAEELSAKFPEGIAIVIIPRAPKPSLEPGVPRAVLRAWRQLQPKLCCAAVLIRSTGVIGALQRGLVSTVINARPRASPVKLSANPFDAAEWVARHTPRHAGTGLLLGRALSAFIEEHEGPVPSGFR